MTAAPRRNRKKIVADELALEEALRTRPELYDGQMFRFDRFSGQTLLMQPVPRVGRPTPTEWTPVDTTDVLVTQLVVWLQAHGYQKVNSGRVNKVIDMVGMDNAFSSAGAFLDALPDWDGTERMHRFWIDVCGAKDAEDWMSEDRIVKRSRYLNATARAFFISICARVRFPGCKADCMPVLEGAQGSLKSTLLRTIAFDNDEWFSDSLQQDIASKDAKAHLAGKLIVEHSEMSQLRASRVETLKQFMTVRHDKFRPSYGRRDIVLYRQCVFVGTTNNRDYLVDITGNRRFWPIACGRIDIDLARKLMPQIYAEALVALAADENWWLPDDIEIIAQEEQDERMVGDLWEDVIRGGVTAAEQQAIRVGEKTYHLTQHELAKLITGENDRHNDIMRKRIAGIMKKLPCEYKRLPRENGVQNWAYVFEISSNGAKSPSHPSYADLRGGRLNS